MIVDDLDDANDHLLGIALVEEMRKPGKGETFAEVAVALIHAIRREGWVPAEERDQAELALNIALDDIEDMKKITDDYEKQIMDLTKQNAVLVAQISGTRVFPGTSTTPYTTTFTSTSPSWIGTTYNTTSALPAAQVATQILKSRKT